MIETVYRDLAEFGLPLITARQPNFEQRLAEIQNHPGPFAPDLESASGRVAILENQSANAVIILRYVWRYTTTAGTTRTASHMNFGSSRQMDLLTGREKPVRDMHSSILPGSRRLITEAGMFGDNRDVLGPPPDTGGRGWGFAGGSGRGGIRGSGPDHDIVRIELELDLAIFEDGLCVGPDESGVRESLMEQIQRQKVVAAEIARELRGGAGPGRIFEILRPLARHGPPLPPALSGGGRHHPSVLSMFARTAIQYLIGAEDATLAAWFEAAAAVSPLRLRRPE